MCSSLYLNLSLLSSPSPLVTVSLFSMFATLFLFCIQIHSLGKTEGNRRTGWKRMRSDSITDSMDMNSSKLWETVMTNLDSIFKSRDITLPTKVRLVKAMVFPVVMYGCESWTVKKAECRRIDAFKLWCWRSLFRVPWTARRSNQSILKEISPGISLEGMMLKLKLQYFGHLLRRVDSLEKLWCWEGLGAEEKGTTDSDIYQFSSVAQPCLTLCDPMNHSTPGLPVHHQLLEFTQTHIHWVSDAIQPSHPLSSPSPPPQFSY